MKTEDIVYLDAWIGVREREGKCKNPVWDRIKKELFEISEQPSDYAAAWRVIEEFQTAPGTTFDEVWQLFCKYVRERLARQEGGKP